MYHIHITDNGAELKYKHAKDYHAAAEDCEIRGSFIKWYSDSLCLTSFPQYWTSGTRYTETFLLRKPCKIFPSPFIGYIKVNK